MPSNGTQTIFIVHCIPIVQAAKLRQGLRFVAGIDVETVVVAYAASLTVHRSGARIVRRPLAVRQSRRNHIAIRINRRAQVLSKPTLVADLHHIVGVAVHCWAHARRSRLTRPIYREYLKHVTDTNAAVLINVSIGVPHLRMGVERGENRQASK